MQTVGIAMLIIGIIWPIVTLSVSTELAIVTAVIPLFYIPFGLWLILRKKNERKPKDFLGER